MPTISGFGMINPDPEIMEYINSLTEQEKQEVLENATKHRKNLLDELDVINKLIVKCITSVGV